MEGLPFLSEKAKKAFLETLQNPDKRDEVLSKMGVDVKNFGRSDVSRDDTIATHRAGLRQQEEILQQQEGVTVGSTEQMSFFTGTHSLSKNKPTFSLASTAGLLPIYLRSMSAAAEGGTSYKGRKIRCTILELPVVVASLMTIIEDDSGGVRRLSVYNLPFLNDPKLKSRARILKAARQKYPVGSRLEIVEPFYKLFRDGSYGVRVDDPTEILVLQKSDENSSLQDWRLEGNRHFEEAQYEEADFCYSRALSLTSDLVPLLLNVSFVATKLEERKWHALQAALAAYAVVRGSQDKSYEAKAKLRLSQALLVSGQHELSEIWSLAPNEVGNTKESHLQEIGLEELSALLPVASFLDWRAFPATKSNKKTKSKSKPSVSRQKALGNDLVAAEKYELALTEYVQGLLADFRDSCAKILSNRSAVALKKNQPLQAMVDSTSALFFDPAFEKAHNRRAQAALALDWSEERVKLVFAACPTSVSLFIRDQRKIKADAVKRKKLKSHGISEKEAKEKMNSKNKTMGADELSDMMARMEFVTGLHPEKAKALPELIDKRIAPIHLEFFRHGRLPKLVSSEKAIEVLRLAYEETRATPLSAIRFTSQLGSGSVNVDQAEFEKRARGDMGMARWLRSETTLVGAVRFASRNAYNSPVFQRPIHHSWSNTSRKPFSPGSRHDAIGFVDLGELLAAELPPSPMKWVGFKSSHYAVAKTLVVLELLSFAPSVSVLEVWFSSTWNKKTYADFRRALQKVLNDPTSKGTSQEVLVLMRLWDSAGVVGIPTARKNWLDSHARMGDMATNLTSEADRLAACSYLLSGDLNASTPEVGSTAMNVFPSHEMTLSLQESVFETVDILAVATLRRKKDCQDVVEAWRQLLLAKIEKLIGLLSTGTIEVEIYHSVVAAENLVTLEKIRKLSPSSLSWSNVCERLHEADRISRSCYFYLPPGRAALFIADELADGGQGHVFA